MLHKNPSQNEIQSSGATLLHCSSTIPHNVLTVINHNKSPRWSVVIDVNDLLKHVLINYHIDIMLVYFITFFFSTAEKFQLKKPTKTTYTIINPVDN